MKTINLIYNSNGFLEEQYEDGSFYIAKEEDKALSFNATFPASLVGSVRAYLQFRGGGDVVECGNININSHTITYDVDAKYLSYNFLKIGFEVITSTKEIRFEPVTIEVDEFVNVGGKSSAEGYTVTVKVGNVTKLAPDEEPYVKNVGTSKDVIFDFGIPGGASKELSFDYYYTRDSMVENYDEYTEPGIYKIKHVLGMHSKVVLMLVRRFSANGVFQLKFSPNQITSRTGNVGEDGKITWEEWGKFATESYVDEKLGDIETALDTIIAMQNELTGGGEV